MRRSRRSIAIAVALGVMTGLVMTGTAFAQDATDGADAPTVFTIGVDSDITGLSPFVLCCGADYEYLELVYDLGIGFNPDDLSPAPAIVTSWEPNEDKMEWTLKVRQDATFNDGEPVTVEDVAFTFSFVADYGLPFFKDYFPFSPTFEVIDEETLLWKSTEPTFAPEVPPYMPILPEHIWSQFATGDDPKEARRAVKDFANDPPVGSGPFELTEYARGQFLRFTYREGHWLGTPAAIDEIVIRIYDNQEAMATALRAGEIDFAESMSPNQFNTVKDDPNITGHVASAGCWGNIAYNFGGQGPDSSNHPAIADRDVRLAIAHAVDRQVIVDRVYQGTAAVGWSILDPAKNSYYYKDIPEELQYPYDPAEGNRILDEAGYLDTDDDGVREMPDGGEPLDFEFMTITDVDGSVDTGRLFQSFLQEIGIKVTFKTVDQAKANDLWFSGDWDVYVWDWCPDPDPDFMLSVFTTDQCLSWSDGCYSNPEYDELYEAQRQATDQEARREIVYEMQDMIAEELPVMVLNYWSDLQAYRSDKWDPAGFSTSPDTDLGVLLFGYGTVKKYLDIVPLGESSGTASSQGLPAWVWVAIVGGVAVIAGGVMFARRGRDTDENVA